jgi:LacI family transcriptional regulator, gluconate utilization system Gnt-I transcriptional repressor
VVTGGTHTARTRKILAGAGIPVVETWDLPADPIGHVVGFSNAEAIGMLVDHIVARGGRRIAFVGGDDLRDSRGAERRQGFLAAMARHGLPADRLVPTGAPPVSMREGALAMRQVLDGLPDTEAVLCVSDLIAYGALTECQRRGVPVPDRLAIAGFGDYEIAGICVPALTTVNPFPAAIGAYAGAVVRDALARDGGPLPEGPLRDEQMRRVVIRPDLRVRQSTG